MFKDTLLIIRHARSELNIRKSEDADCNITNFGVKQATTVGKFMGRHMNLDGFSYYTSPFLRCLQTAGEIVNGVSKVHSALAGEMQFKVLDDLREYINHCHREVTVRCHSGAYPEFDWSDFPKFAEEPDLSYKDEQNEELLNRVHRLYRGLPEKSVVVTHGLPALTLVRVATGRGDAVPIWDHCIDNASMTLIKGGRIVWLGRNLYPECDHDPFDKVRAYDAADLIVA
jgi:broad specificity phosphatase PhoE